MYNLVLLLNLKSVLQPAGYKSTAQLMVSALLGYNNRSIIIIFQMLCNNLHHAGYFPYAGIVVS